MQPEQSPEFLDTLGLILCLRSKWTDDSIALLTCSRLESTGEEFDPNKLVGFINRELFHPERR